MSLIRYLTRIHFADGVVEAALPVEVERLGLRRPLVVTDAGVVAAGVLERVLGTLPASVDVTVYDGTPESPTETAALDAAALYRARRCGGLIGLGGGSALDLAKAVCILAAHEGPLRRYAAVEGGVARIRSGMPPLIAIPTTAGSGSEVGTAALIRFGDGRKLGLISPHLIPTVAICDPTLTLGLPPRLTAGTGMDALTHCVEAYVATAFNPPADGIALDGLARIAASLERAVDNGGDIAARREMMAAALNGALAFQKGLGGVHAMSHALGGLDGYRLHHGTLTGVLLPHVLAFNAPAVGHRFPALRHAMGVPEGVDLGDAVARLAARVGMPARLGEMGVDRAAIERAAPLAERDHTNGTNPRRTGAADYRRLLEAAL